MVNNPDSASDISSSPNTSEQFELDFDDYNKYIGSKVLINSTIGSIAGISIGYYLESGMFLHFYTYGLVASAVTVPFFTTNYLLRNVRKKNDIYNYALSGSLTGGLLGSIKGKKFSIFASIVSTFLGGSYKVIEDVLYDTSRTAWLNSRRFTVHNSQPAKALSRRHQQGELKREMKKV